MRTLFFTLLIFLSATASSQDRKILDKLCQEIQNSCVTMDYTYSARVSGINYDGSGTLISQGQMWKVVGNGIEMYCDAKSVWVIDRTAKEVVIEPVSDQKAGVLANPARVFLDLGESFDISAVVSSGDSKALIYSLVPKSDTDVDYLNVEVLKESSLIRRMSFALADGTMVKIEVNSMKLTPDVADDMFRVQEKFDSRWIVTDLR